MPNSWRQFLLSLVTAFDNPLIAALVLFIVAMMCMLLIGNPMIEWLQNKRWKKDATNEETWAVREDTPDTHQQKQGTPSMGGIGIITASILSFVAVLSSFFIITEFVGNSVGNIRLERHFGSLDIAFTLVLPLAFLLHGVLGFADDRSKASGHGGLKARHKLLWQITMAFGLVTLLPLLMLFWRIVPHTPYAGFLPLVFSFSRLVCLIFLALALVATCNAVNLTDGIDGLASGLMVQSGIALFLVGTRNGNNLFFSNFFCIALAGACFGFLFFNRYPARVFMGDTGSLAIGAALGAGAILQHAVFLLPFIGFIYFVEMFSVITQVLWFKWTKRKTGEGQRLFRRAPLHHHFELGGWSEWRVVGTFWAINLLTSAIGLWLWHAGVIPRWP